jgi:aldehyde dehydrogenase (NAD+)
MAIIDGRRSYVAGRWVQGVQSFAVENPADESCLALAGVTPIEEVRRAITEARSSFDEGEPRFSRSSSTTSRHLVKL